MPVSMVERTHAPAAREELERRHALVRAAMADVAIDALFVHNHVDGLGGATRWFADLGTGGGYPVTIVFPAVDPMTVIVHGPIGGDSSVPPDDPLLPGVGRVRTTASFSSANYCDGYDADVALQALRPLGPGRVGIVGAAQIPWSMIDHLTRHLDGVELVDARPLIDPIKAIKSSAEQAVLRATAAMQDAALRYAFEFATPGMRESDLAAAVQRFSQEHGSEGGAYMVGQRRSASPRRSACATTRTA